MDEPRVQHDPDHGHFFIELDGYRGELMYARRGELLDFYHVYVPEPYRDQGMAAQILTAAFDYVRQNGLKVVPSCPYVVHAYVPRTPEIGDLVESEKDRFPFAGSG